MLWNEDPGRYGPRSQCRSRFILSPSAVDGRRYWQCAHCRAQTTLCSGTLFHETRLPLTNWIQAIYLVSQKNLSALSLKRQLGVCYRTARRVKHKLLEAMVQREDARIVDANDAVLRSVHAGKPDQASQTTCPFIAAV